MLWSRTVNSVPSARSVEHSWLVKSEPTVYSIDDLARDGRTAWEGVRNFQARNFMRDGMRPGELVLFAHSNADPSGIAGLAKVASASYADPSQFDRSSPFFDERATSTAPRWHLVDLAFVERFREVLSLERLRREAGLADLLLLKRGTRLSVQPVALEHLELILRLAGAKTRTMAQRSPPTGSPSTPALARESGRTRAATTGRGRQQSGTRRKDGKGTARRVPGSTG